MAAPSTLTGGADDCSAKGACTSGGWWPALANHACTSNGRFWVDLQVLRAVAEIERALLDEEDPEVHYNEARLTLENAAKMLNTIEQQLAKKQKPGQIADQWKTLNALRQQILPAPTS